MDVLTLAAGLALAAGSFGYAWRMRRRALHADAEVARLRGELQAERHAASHDSLTGLPNRRAFYQLGARLVADRSRHPLIAVVLDLDDFKQINDRLGHAAGDQVLVTTARRFATYAGDNLVARLGGDEFAGLLTSSTVDGRWLAYATHRLADTLAAPMRVAGRVVQVTASIGLVPVVPGCTHLSEALRYADRAMYRAKTSRGYVAAASARDGSLGHHPDRWPPERPPGPGPEKVAPGFDRHPHAQPTPNAPVR